MGSGERLPSVPGSSIPTVEVGYFAGSGERLPSVPGSSIPRVEVGYFAGSGKIIPSAPGSSIPRVDAKLPTFLFLFSFFFGMAIFRFNLPKL